MTDELLKIEDLRVSIASPAGKVQAVRGVDLTLRRGEVLAIVGESGCGKTVLCRSLMKLLPPSAVVESGRIIADGRDITALSEREMRLLRGNLLSMIFQDPMLAMNPTISVGKQISEAVRLHTSGLSRREVRRRAVELMELVGIRQAEERFDLYPCHLSGGMRQRAVMAIALAGSPKILLADEPTTALDVTIQAQILDLLRRLQKKMSMATILVSHDLGVVAQAADRVAIMYAGRIAEIGTAEEIFHDPRHPYTKGLLGALPALNRGATSLKTIPGMPPSLINPPPGDAFAWRNPQALAMDYLEQPPMFRVSDTHFAATWCLDPRAEGGEARA